MARALVTKARGAHSAIALGHLRARGPRSIIRRAANEAPSKRDYARALNSMTPAEEGEPARSSIQNNWRKRAVNGGLPSPRAASSRPAEASARVRLSPSGPGFIAAPRVSVSLRPPIFRPKACRWPAGCLSPFGLVDLFRKLCGRTCWLLSIISRDARYFTYSVFGCFYFVFV